MLIMQDHEALVEKHVALARKLREHMESQAEPAEDSARAQMQQALAAAVTDAFTLTGKLAAAEEKLRWGTPLRWSRAAACSVFSPVAWASFDTFVDNSEAWWYCLHLQAAGGSGNSSG